MALESDPMDRELLPLSVRAIEGSMTPNDWTRLEQLLANHPEACARWQVLMQFHSDLRTFSTISRSEQTVLQAILGQTELPERRHPDIDPEARAKVLALNQPRHTVRIAVVWGAALAASVLVAAFGVWWQSTPADPPITEFGPNGAPVLALGPLHFPEGIAKYYLEGVGELLVEGPVQLHLDATKKMRLDHGRIRVHVREPSGRGFQVATCQGNVVDLGTEFAIHAMPDRAVDVVVFDGEVKLDREPPSGSAISERLEEGEGLSLSPTGVPTRLMQIFTGASLTFRHPGDSSMDESSPIVRISDNLPSKDTKRFYEIVPRGFRDDAKAYVDRNYEWNGLTETGLPEFLEFADYIKTFNGFKGKDFEITIEFAKPCRLYVLWDQRATPPAWLSSNFEMTNSFVGLDEGPFKGRSRKEATDFGVGPGTSIDGKFSVWVHPISGPGTFTLGSSAAELRSYSMYGIAVSP